MHMCYNIYAINKTIIFFIYFNIREIIAIFVLIYYVYTRQRAALKAHGGSVRGAREPNGYPVAGTLAESHVRFLYFWLFISSTLTCGGI